MLYGIILSNIPIGQNLGSSAALCVSASAALLEFYTDRQFNKDAVNSVAYQAEKYFHKNASGVDVSTSCHGGLIYYRKEFEFLKTISALHQKLPKKFEDNLFLINSGKAMETTGDMVDRMGKLYNAKPEKTEKILNEIEKITKRMVVSVIKEDDVYFKKNISDNEILLEKLGVVSTRAIKLLKQLSSYGAGKMTGAGGIKQGSGFLIFYADKPQELIDFLNKQKITFYKFRQNQTGLQRL
ncbi:MAG: Mevalonate kinase [Candidatus Roizmanbacteria bacterium GW2011_GWA2_36_23]|uniref:Mevalonate kinase n=1 Tax=Candidatus Roizmanbacteria bacterium GW2011_GWA2_36_23 TaxID=1618480 RepID=A0A0G0E7T4_9BACT|nr:MAG: Mevalonate kinase [Candidatus Roizmanbacteria bacterium GW2011_GWA2_36_23]